MPPGKYNYEHKLSPTEGRVFIQTHGIPNMDFLCNAETKTARTKTALNLLGLAPWKNTHLLGTSNVISFLGGTTDGLQSGWSKQFTDYDKQDAFVA